MNKAMGAAEIDEVLEREIGRNIHEAKRAGAAFRHPDDTEGEMSGHNLGTLLRQVTEQSTHEIEKLIDELQGLRKKLQTDGDSLQSAIARHSELSQDVTQLTTIISDNVKRLPKPTYQGS
jgi:ABC-type transporter Mla subunit MlaD